MQFIDHTGHIFSMKSYPNNPIGYEYDETDYIFWVDSEYSNKLSVDTYYMKPIRVLIEYNKRKVNNVVHCAFYNASDDRCNCCEEICKHCFKYAGINKLCGNYHPEIWINCQLCQNTCEYFWDDITVNGRRQCPHYNYADERCHWCGRWQGNFRNNLTNNGLRLPNGCEHYDPDNNQMMCATNCGNGCEWFWYNVEGDRVCQNYDSTKEKCQNCSYTCIHFLQYMDNRLNKTYIVEDEVEDDDYNVANDVTIEIKVDSKKFGLIGSKTIHDKLNNDDKSVSILEKQIKQTLRNPDIEFISGLKLNGVDSNSFFALATFYVVCKSDEPGIWESNIMIHTNDEINGDLWCPITVGGEIVDECEELVINGKNVGIKLPKDIVKAMYQSNVFSSVPDESLFNRKMKELLMNYMVIKGEEGNYKSAIAALKWFGWGDKLKLYKLLKTDNELLNQYLRDDFDIVNDVITSYKHFRNDALLALSVPITYEGEEEKYVFTNDFWGENKPKILDSFKRTEIVHYDEGDIDFYKNHFDFSFSELGIKLVFLKYYYEKFFLPVHMHLNSVSMIQQVWANDIKFINKGFPKITANPVLISDPGINVVFPKTHTLYFDYKKEIMDEKFNVFTDTEKLAKTDDSTVFYYSYDNVVEIPIKFTSVNSVQFYDVILGLYKDNKLVYTSNFIFTQAYAEDAFGNIKSDSEYQKFIIHPKSLNTFINEKQHNSKFDINYWLSSNYKITLYVNGNNYEYDFTINLPEMNLCMGTLEYKYDDRFKQLAAEIHENESDETQNEIITKFQSYMHMPGLVTINNIDFIEDLYYFQNSLEDYLKKYYKSSLNINKKFMNRCHIYKIEIPVIENNKEKYKEIPATANDETFIELFKLGNENEDGNTEFISIAYDNELYDRFFEYDSENKIMNEIEELSNLVNSKKMKYDVFFMAEGETTDTLNKINLGNWYMILISKDTIDEYNNDDINAPFDEHEFIFTTYDKQLNTEQIDDSGSTTYFYKNENDEYIEIENISEYLNENDNPELYINIEITHKYKFTYEKSDIKFLVNRFVLNDRDNIESENYGKYHFKNDDLVAFYLRSNKNLQYKVGLSTKWEIKPISIGMANSSKSESPNEIGIFGIGGTNFKYENGYYNVVCRFSLDDYIQHSMTKTAKFRVD